MQCKFRLLSCLQGKKEGCCTVGVKRPRVASQISTSKALNLSSTMASHGDTAEGGANEEFNDIIKWRSGMFVSQWIFQICSVTDILHVFHGCGFY